MTTLTVDLTNVDDALLSAFERTWAAAAVHERRRREGMRVHNRVMRYGRSLS